ncbi:hypothetical protein [Lacinutrix algicola]|uniref:hypothetical protein n=1 Tax=Lacinutrix algicola TaxID=342954 RepID=UPI0006E18CCE|nr:hypothetical protein [Lacinutrix algicola]
MKKQTTLILAILFALILQAQTERPYLDIDRSQFNEEETQIQINSNLVLVGEYLYYKMFALSNGELSNISKIGYVELIDKNGKTVVKHILNLKNSASSQRIFVPSELKTGHYKLLAYTKWSKNNTKKNYSSKDIYIINAFSNSVQQLTNAKALIKLNKAETIKKQDQKNNEISISTQKQSYTNRDLVTINIETSEDYKNGNYSLSINKLDSISISSSLKTEENFVTEQEEDTLFIPEMRGQLISGKITNLKNPLNVENKTVALSIPGEQYLFRIATTNNSGQFLFNLNNETDSNKATFQVIEDNKEDYNIKLFETSKNKYKNLSFHSLEIDNNLKFTLEQRNIKNQIENAYYLNKRDSILSKSKIEPFYKSKEKTYVLDDYTRFKTVRETFIEVVNYAGLRKENDNYKIVVYDRYDEKKNEVIKDADPLVIVDGMIVQNNNDLVNYDSNKIESISVVIGQYFYGSKLYQGVISVSTFDKEFKVSLNGDFIMETVLNLPEDETIYFQPQYLNSIDNKHIPDYRRQLLWIPETKLNNSRNSFTTYTSDDKGTYKITLEGYNSKGEFTKSSSYFTVN